MGEVQGEGGRVGRVSRWSVKGEGEGKGKGCRWSRGWCWRGGGNKKGRGYDSPTGRPRRSAGDSCFCDVAILLLGAAKGLLPVRCRRVAVFGRFLASYLMVCTFIFFFRFFYVIFFLFLVYLKNGANCYS